MQSEGVVCPAAAFVQQTGCDHVGSRGRQRQTQRERNPVAGGGVGTTPKVSFGPHQKVCATLDVPFLPGRGDVIIEVDLAEDLKTKHDVVVNVQPDHAVRILIGFGTKTHEIVVRDGT